jgi:hypothetical protein
MAFTIHQKCVRPHQGSQGIPATTGRYLLLTPYSLLPTLYSSTYLSYLFYTYDLITIYYLLLTICCLLLATHYSLHTTRYLPLTLCYLLLTTFLLTTHHHWWQITTYCSPLTTHYLLLTTYYTLLTADHLLTHALTDSLTVLLTDWLTSSVRNQRRNPKWPYYELKDSLRTCKRFVTPAEVTRGLEVLWWSFLGPLSCFFYFLDAFSASLGPFLGLVAAL